MSVYYSVYLHIYSLIYTVVFYLLCLAETGVIAKRGIRCLSVREMPFLLFPDITAI